MGVELVSGEGGEWSVVSDEGTADVRLHGVVFPRAARGDLVDLRSTDPAGHPAARRRRPDPSGRLTALRTAAAVVGAPSAVDIVIDLPEGTRPAGVFPVATVATAGITAAVAALFFSPIFALLAGVSAFAVIGRWAGSFLAHGRSERRGSEARLAAFSAWEQAAAVWSSSETEVRRRASLQPNDLSILIDGESSPWRERLDGALNLVVGHGSLTVEVDVADVKTLDEVVSSQQRRVVLDAVPIIVGLEPGLAVCGDRSEVLEAARWMVCSALARFGPADMGLVLVTTADRVADWDQLKWSSALAGCVVVDEDSDDALSDGLAQAGAGGVRDVRPVLVVVDGAEPTGSGLLARLLSGRLEHTMLLWLGAPDDVPAGCRSSLSVASDGGGLLDHLDHGDAQSICWFGYAADEWSRGMRWLARFDDPECIEVGQGLPSSAALCDLVAEARTGANAAHGLGGFARSLERRWASASAQHLHAVIGLDDEGPVAIDLVADGPHVLAAGTTGAGKSELLRTLVVGLASQQPPEVVSFVLIDFKGGGAFDVVAPLPHVAAVVTDLDPAEASRALRGLRAEILDREHRLRDMEISDVCDIDRYHVRSFGRMVVIVDEFAALAEELPDFLDGLVDIARRGRSLGVHLVLATQRPSGVVTGQIRANTNLRLCLRVQDRSDSIDVIDDPMAGRLPAIPGRAVLRSGGGRCHQLQVAQVSGQRGRPTAEPFRLHPSVMVSDAQRAVVRSVAAACAPTDDSELVPVSLVDLIVAAADGRDRVAAPWTIAPRSASYPVRGDMVGALDSGGSSIGLLDDPDRRLIIPMQWLPHADGLLVVGADQTQLAATAATAVAATLERDPSLATFVLDGDRSGSASLAGLAALDPVVDIVGVAEPERLLRAVEQLERTTEPRMVVIHEWAAIVDALVDLAGPLGAERLTKLARKAGTPGTALVVTARTDRDVPQRAASSLGCRVVHRLADPAGLLSFGLRPAEFGSLDGSRFVDPGSGLVGVIAQLDRCSLADLADRTRGSGARSWPGPVQVLGSHVDRATLPSAEMLPDGWRVAVGLDVNLAPHWIMVSPRRPVVVLGHHGGGRTTAVTTVSAALSDRVCVIDDADALDDRAVAEKVEEAKRDEVPVVIGCTPAHAKRFGSVVAALLSNATVVLLNPGRSEGELVRLALPDLTDQPVGRAVSVDRGRATIVQIAA